MGNEWHYTQNGQAAAAPVGTTQLKQLAASGQLKPEDLLWQEGMPNWVPASSVKGLFSTTKSGETAGTPRSPQRSTKADVKPVAKPEPTKPPAQDEGFHPVLALLLTVLTLGIFGILYALRVGNHYRAHCGAKTIDAAGRPLGVVRHPVVMLVLTFLTFGYYLSYWISCVLRECANYTNQRDLNARTELALMLVIPFYTFYLAVNRVPEVVRRVQAQAGMDERSAPLTAGFYWNPLLIFTLPVLCMSMQDALNQVWINAT